MTEEVGYNFLSCDDMRTLDIVNNEGNQGKTAAIGYNNTSIVSN